MMQAQSLQDTAIAAPHADRLVVFLGGFDPRGARYYHRLCSEQALLQGCVDGNTYMVSPRRPLDIPADAQSKHRHAQWYLKDSQGATSKYVFFDWSAQVRDHWPRSIWAVWLDAIYTYFVILSRFSVLKPLRSKAPRTLLTFFYPLFFALIGVLAALGCGVVAAAVSHYLFKQSLLLHAIIGLGVASLVIGLCGRIDRQLHVSWLLRIFNFARACAHDPSQLSDARVKAMAKWLARQQAIYPTQEIVVVGFSVGSVKALALIHEWEKDRGSTEHSTPISSPSLTLLSLGNCIPLFSLMPGERHVRDLLHAVGNDQSVYWVDISSPGDSVSFAMCDLQRLANPDKKVAKAYVNPRHMCTPRFHMLFSPHSYRWIRRNKMRMHFQYLMASEQPGAYSFYALLTTPKSVREFVKKLLIR